MNVRLGGKRERGAVAITPKQPILMKSSEIAASNAGVRLRVCMSVLKPVCSEGWGASRRGKEGGWRCVGGGHAHGARDQCAALFITAAVHQPQICVRTRRGADCRSAFLERLC